LAILRWISDYWSSNPGTATHDNATTQQDDIPQNASHAETNGGARTDTAASSQAVPPTQQRDVEWNELLPMLTVEIDHMEAEVEELQSLQHGTNGGATQSQEPSGRRRQDGKNTSSSNAFEDLQSMLLSLNVDERAEPAVMAYRRAVGSFPPQKRTAFLISLLRRTPALLTVIFHVLFGGTTSLLFSFIVLSPFIVMEYFRVTSWISRCQSMPNISLEATQQEETIDRLVPRELAPVDSMTILLCGDSHPTLKPPTLLLVWHNIVSSVSALEVGLTAARCAETTAVAVQFAGNVVSLAHFGLEVSQHGLLHGLGIVLKEAISAGGNFSNLDDVDDNSMRYTKAAVGAFQSGQRVARNVQRLGEDEHLGAVVQPVLMALNFLSGQGWLWGKEPEAGPDGHSSNVVIVELHDDEVITPEERTTDENASDCRSERQQSKSPPPQSPNDTGQVEKPELQLSPQHQPCTDIKSEAINAAAPLQDPQEELSIVMEMVAQAYEQDLIDDAEKSDFILKMSMLRREELSDLNILSSMKRTLKIILENGCATTLMATETEEDVCFEVLDSSVTDDGQEPKEQSENDENVKNNEDLDNLQLTCEDETNHPSPPEAEFVQQVVTAEKTNGQDNTNDALFRLGAAAVGVVAGGLLLSLTQRNENVGDRGDGNDRQHNTTPAGEGSGDDRYQSSSVQIQELSEDDDDDNWVNVPQ
ncbi:MAG: hypothetical protein SGILL_002204, partial [Bacillariaceae sp.]